MKLRQITRLISMAAVSIFIATFMTPTGALAAGPTNTALPTIAGTLAVGQTVTAGSGSWDVAPSSISYQWYRCSTASLVSCTQITGATTFALKLVAADGGNYLQLQVTALSAGGGTTSSSAISGMVLNKPEASVPPAISGIIQVGSTLTISNGTWINVIAPTFTYQWQRCASVELSSCVDIPLAINSTFVITYSDVARYIRGSVNVAASVNNLVATASSNLTAQITSEPSLVTPPTISGEVVTDELLTATSGSYNSFPAATYVYQWQSCTTPEVATCAPINGATLEKYKLLVADAGKYFRVMVTASNNLGGRISPSLVSSKVLLATIPEVISAPVINGIAKHREILNVSMGVWVGIPTGVITYQWQSCSDLIQLTCLDIIGETKTSYKLAFADVDKYVRVKLTNTNRIGSASTVSALTNKIVYATQLQTSPLAIGFVQVGQKWSATPGTWVGAEAPKFGYQWQNCVSLDVATCTDISEATQAEYIAQTTDMGKYLRVKNWIVSQSSVAFSDIVPVKITAAPKTLVQTPALNPKPAVIAKPVVKKTTITCIKGKLAKKVSAVAPKCPTGYKKK